MNIVFTEIDHKYKLLETGDEYISVTTLVKVFCSVFEKEKRAISSSKNRKSKWYGIEPKEIEKQWDRISEESIKTGKWWHLRMEESVTKFSHIVKDGRELGVFKTDVREGIKYSTNQRLSNNSIYPEHLVYLDSVKLSGQSDVVEVIDNVLYIRDFKTNREIKRVGFTNWEGITKKLLKPLYHLDDCELNLYSLQLSLYAYMILRHNPNLTLGKLTIEHVKFVETGKDEYGYPLLLIENNEPVIDTIELVECRYMKSEVQTLIEWLKKPGNRESIIKH